MHILLFGKDGQVGWELQRSLAVLGRLTALSHDSTDYCGDFTNPQGLASTIQALRPDVIVNATGYTAVDKAELERNLAKQINSSSVKLLAEEANKLGAWLVHFSTDYVFSGDGNTPWREDDLAYPLNYYGVTKYEGELAARECNRHLIFRCSWIHSARGNNFIKTMLKLGAESNILSVVNDQFGAPTSASMIADITAHAIKTAVKTESVAGLYHVASSGTTTWFDYAQHVFMKAAEYGFDMINKDIIGVSSSCYITAAKRPCNSRLDLSKLQNTFGLVMPVWQSGVDRTLAELLGR